MSRRTYAVSQEALQRYNRWRIANNLTPAADAATAPASAYSSPRRNLSVVVSYDTVDKINELSTIAGFSNISAYIDQLFQQHQHNLPQPIPMAGQDGPPRKRRGSHAPRTSTPTPAHMSTQATSSTPTPTHYTQNLDSPSVFVSKSGRHIEVLSQEISSMVISNALESITNHNPSHNPNPTTPLK